jgi:uncharacterized integral membrane protein (TIGR00697 family)
MLKNVTQVKRPSCKVKVFLQPQGAGIVTAHTHILMMDFSKKENKLFLFLSGFFIVNAVVAEFVGNKIFSVEESLGFERLNLSLLNVPGLSFNMSAGVIMWPLVFILTDILNEYFGEKGVRRISNLTVILITYSFIMVFMAMRLTPSDFWINKNIDGQTINMDLAFNAVFGQGLWIIAGSITAFLSSQIIDVLVFQRIKRATGEKALWLRATGSTIVSQFIDSFVVIFIAFYLNPDYDWSFRMVAAIGLVNYSYKFLIAILMTPLLYIVHAGIDRYLGRDLAEQLIKKAGNKAVK